MRLGYSAGRVLLDQSEMPAGERPAVLIGKDTRLSGYMLESALEAGFSAAGVGMSGWPVTNARCGLFDPCSASAGGHR